MMNPEEAAPNLLVSKEPWYALPFLYLVNVRKFARPPQGSRQALLRAPFPATAKRPSGTPGCSPEHELMR